MDKICIQPYGLAAVPVPGSLRCYARRLHQKPEKQRWLHSFADHCCWDQIAIYGFLETPSVLGENQHFRLCKKVALFCFAAEELQFFHVLILPLGSVQSGNKSPTIIHLKRQIYEFNSAQLPARATVARCPRTVRAGQMLPQLSAPAVGVGCFNFPKMPSFPGVLRALGALF